MKVDVRTPSGESAGATELDDAIFAVKVNGPLMHQVVLAQLAAARSGTHATKTRGEVSGGGAKPWRQKGTGRARHGSSREPQWKGGGAVFGPKPRDYAMSVPKKMKAAALRSALSARAGEGHLHVVDGLAFSKPKTKDAIKALGALGVEGKVLLVLTSDEVNVAFAFRNLPTVHVLAEHQLNTYDVLNAVHVLFTKSALEAFQTRATGTTQTRATGTTQTRATGTTQTRASGTTQTHAEDGDAT